jgi:signal transduction histidine kinase
VENKVKGFDCGGVDFVDKPFWPKEVKARVATHIQLKEQKRELATQLSRLKELEQLRDDLVHMVVHDMRSPIGVMKVYLDFLHEDGVGVFDDQQMKNIEEAMSCAEKLNDIAESLLDVSRLESGKMPLTKEPCDLVEIVSKAAETPPYPFEDRKAKLSIQTKTAMVECDPGLIRRVLKNLVGNAFKFTPSSGKVAVEIEKRQGNVHISVKDTGEGIPEEFLDKIFQKFISRQSARRRKKYYSTGLGLAFCKLAVEAHGGTIEVESQLGTGSCFRFTLPLAPD